MVVFHRLEEVPRSQQGTVVAVGNFDGIHVGHRALLESVVQRASESRLTPALLTFFPHPVEVLRPDVPFHRLTTASEKLSLLEKLGIELVLVAPFDARLSAMQPAEFFETFIVKGMSARAVHVGFNFHFGKGRAGDTAAMEVLCKNWGVSLQVQAPVEVGGVRCSSSAVREALTRGDLEHASQLLGRPYSVTGQVVKGEGRGRKIGFPTANLRLPAEKLLPKTGVYLTRATWQRQEFKAVANLGLRPTFETPQTLAPVLEVHFLDFNASLYDEFVEIEFLQRIRNEEKFESVDALKKQIAKDVAWARDYQLS